MDRADYDAVGSPSITSTTTAYVRRFRLWARMRPRARESRIGTGVTLAALYHPLRLAEELALLDILSGGASTGVPGAVAIRGSSSTFGVPIEESQRAFARRSIS